ncbi:MAG: DUF364 domain-containing protein [Proteobacteria bacterium]|nr:DUF364 domain-containing protein [Pseudomonadota bacterium]
MNTHSCTQPPTAVPDCPLEGDEKNLIDSMLSSIIRPDAVVEEIITGSRFIAVKAGGRMGLSSLLGAKPMDHEQNLTDQMTGKDVSEIACLIRKPSPFTISLGFAALNAGNTPDPKRVEPSNFPADDLIARLGKDKITGLVGEFPFVASLKNRVGTLHVFELRDIPGAVPRDQWEHMLGKLDVFAITGTALLTRSMAWFLSRAPQAKIVILGPTTPFSPSLFSHGADYLCGSVISDMEKVAHGIRAGLPFKKVKQNGGVIFTQWEKNAPVQTF